MMLSVWNEVRNLPYSNEILYTYGADADTHRFALIGLYYKSRGK